jgi:hypothetical protein
LKREYLCVWFCVWPWRNKKGKKRGEKYVYQFRATEKYSLYSRPKNWGFWSLLWKGTILREDIILKGVRKLINMFMQIKCYIDRLMFLIGFYKILNCFWTFKFYEFLWFLWFMRFVVKHFTFFWVFVQNRRIFNL